MPDGLKQHNVQEMLGMAEIARTNAENLETQLKLKSRKPVMFQKLLRQYGDSDMDFKTGTFVGEKLSDGYRITKITTFGGHTLERYKSLRFRGFAGMTGVAGTLAVTVGQPLVESLSAEKAQSTEYKPAVRAEGIR